LEAQENDRRRKAGHCHFRVRLHGYLADGEVPLDDVIKRVKDAVGNPLCDTTASGGWPP